MLVISVIKNYYRENNRDSCYIGHCLAMPYYSSILPLVFVNEAPRTLRVKTTKQPITRAGGDTLTTPIFLPHV